MEIVEQIEKSIELFRLLMGDVVVRSSIAECTISRYFTNLCPPIRVGEVATSV